MRWIRDYGGSRRVLPFAICRSCGQEGAAFRLKPVLQLADIEVGNPVEIPDIAGRKRRPRHQGSRRNKAVQSLDAIAGAELAGKLCDA